MMYTLPTGVCVFGGNRKLFNERDAALFTVQSEKKPSECKTDADGACRRVSVRLHTKACSGLSRVGGRNGKDLYSDPCRPMWTIMQVFAPTCFRRARLSVTASCDTTEHATALKGF